MNYEDIKTPYELLEFMKKNINYGFVDEDEKIYSPEIDEQEFESAVINKWKLSNIKHLLKYGYGHCWDCVELERDWFNKHNFIYKTFYIWFELPYSNEFSTHTYLIFEDNNKFYYFEYSDFNNRGIHEFNSLESLIEYQKEKFIKYNRNYGQIDEDTLKHLHIYEYDKPNIGCTFDEFIDHILKNKKVI